MDFYGFFNGVYLGTDDEGYELYDREYDANDLAAVVGAFYLNGIFPYESTYFQVMAAEDLEVAINKGQGHVEGRFFKSDEIERIRLKDPDPSLPRIDRIVVRLDITKREIVLAAKEGAPGSKPKAPKLQRDNDVYELGLAEVTVRPGVKDLGQGDVKDTRFNSDICGVVAHALERLDIEDLRQQYSKELADLVKLLDDKVKEEFLSVDELVKELENYILNSKEDLVKFVEANKEEILNLIQELNDLIAAEGVGGEIISKLNNKLDKHMADELNGKKYTIVFKNGELYKREVI